MALSNKQTCPKAPKVPTGTPTGTGTLVAVFFADDDDLDAVDMALLGADDVVAADPAVAVTAGTHVGILLLERNAGACFGAGRFNAESHGVGRRRLGLDAADRLVDILHQLVDAANADHALGSEHDRRHSLIYNEKAEWVFGIIFRRSRYDLGKAFESIIFRSVHG